MAQKRLSTEVFDDDDDAIDIDENDPSKKTEFRETSEYSARKKQASSVRQISAGSSGEINNSDDNVFPYPK